MLFYNRYSVLGSAIAILFVLLINKIPLSDLLEMWDLSPIRANSIEDVFFNTLILTLLLWIVRKQRIPFYFFAKDMSLILYYLPLLFFLFIFTGGFSSVRLFAKLDLSPATWVLFGLETLTASFLEEFLFRGLILGVIVVGFVRTADDNLAKPVLMAAVLFGATHITNLWSNEPLSVGAVFNQVYATTSLGFMLGAVYLKTRNLLALSITHFISNFLAGMSTIGIAPIGHQMLMESHSLVDEVIEGFFRLIIFGLPFLLGIVVLRFINADDRLAFVPELREEG